MPLNIKNPEVERLAAEIASATHTSKTETIRIALIERAGRLKAHRGKLTRADRIDSALSAFRKNFPKADYGKTLTKRQTEKLLGYGPDGV